MPLWRLDDGSLGCAFEQAAARRKMRRIAAFAVALLALCSVQLCKALEAHATGAGGQDSGATTTAAAVLDTAALLSAPATADDDAPWAPALLAHSGDGGSRQLMEARQVAHPHHRRRRRGRRWGEAHGGARCVGAVGPWCGGYYRQPLLPFKPPPVQGKPCPGDCSGVGVCHGDRGVCDCPAGWGGPDCAAPHKRPCTKNFRNPRNSTTPNRHIGPDMRDLNWTAPESTYSRCAGICDDDIAACYCDPKLGNPKYGRIPAPPGSPPGTPPKQEGRPLFDPCNRLADDGRGNKLSWHGWGIPYERVYGPDGWCVADKPKVPACGCGLDGYGGLGCELPSEMFCPNQCSGRGRCRRGFCQCNPGWWGLDCAHAASAAAAATPRPPPPPWLRRLAIDGWACAAQGLGCADSIIEADEREANWTVLLPPFDRSNMGSGGQDSSSGAQGSREEGEEDESDEASAFRLAGARHRGTTTDGTAPANREREPPQAQPQALVGEAAPAAAAGSDGQTAASSAGASQAAAAGAGGVPTAEVLQQARPRRWRAEPAQWLLSDAEGYGEAGGPGYEGTAEDEPQSDAAMLRRRRLRAERLQQELMWQAAADRSSPIAGDGGGERGGLREPLGFEGDEGQGQQSKQQSKQQVTGRRRPLIYVYDVPGPYVSRMLSYRLLKDSCTWRIFDADPNNKTRASPFPYGSEPLLLDLLLSSPHRTLDPEEADFFFVPTLTTCWFHPIAGWADYPWWYVDTWSRVKHAVTLTHELLQWVKTAHPYWNRTNGADHIWHFAHDEGACWAPTEVYERSIIITHWGRMDKDHSSGTTYYPDNYTAEVWDDPFQPEGFTHLIKGHPCYTPGKDIVVPLFRGPEKYKFSPYLGALQPPRDILLFHRGRMGLKDSPAYSRGVRQRVARAAKAGNWSARYNIHVGGYDEIEGEYGELLARSVFCLVAAGDGWSARFDDAMLHGCIPVIVMDGVVGPWGHQLRWSAFSIRIPEADVESLPEILTAIPPARVRRMQRAMAAVWHRFAWLAHPMLHALVREHMEANVRAAAEAIAMGDIPGQLERPWLRALQPGEWRDDAFHTLLQWLFHKLEVRGTQRAAAAGSPVGPQAPTAGSGQQQVVHKKHNSHEVQRRGRRPGGGGQLWGAALVDPAGADDVEGGGGPAGEV